MKPRTPWQTLRWVLSLLLLAGLFVELALRAATAWKEPKGRFTWMLGKNRLEVLAERDGYRFFTGRKNTTVEFGPMHFEFNNLGYRSRSKEIRPKTGDKFRVACFGDSVTFGQYDRDFYETWPGAVERLLRDQETSKEIEVINFGMAHYTYVTSLVNLALIGSYVRPDIVIFLIGPNDFISLYIKDYAEDGTQDGTWLLPITDFVWGFHPVGTLVDRSRVGALIHGALVKGLLLLHAKAVFTLEPSEEQIRSRLEIMGRHLATICALSRSIGAMPVLCTYVYDEARLVQTRGARFPPVLEAIDETIRTAAGREQAVLVEANSRMKTHPEYFRDDFHLSPKGSEVFARCVVESLAGRGLLPQAGAPTPTESVRPPEKRSPGRGGHP